MTIKNTVDCVDEGCPHWGTVHSYPALAAANKHVHRWQFVGIISDPDAPYYADEYEYTVGLWECECGATTQEAPGEDDY